MSRRANTDESMRDAGAGAGADFDFLAAVDFLAVVPVEFFVPDFLVADFFFVTGFLVADVADLPVVESLSERNDANRLPTESSGSAVAESVLRRSTVVVSAVASDLGALAEEFDRPLPASRPVAG